MKNNSSFQSLNWQNDGLYIIDQTFLPDCEVYLDLTSSNEVWEAIKKLRVRGAPAIGIAAAYGLYLGIKDLPETNFETFFNESERVADYLNTSRPTAVNLSWALNKVLSTLASNKEKSISDLKKLALDTAKAIHREDIHMCELIGKFGAELVPDNAAILTHCNTGGLATAKYGTALSVIIHAHQAKKVNMVWVDETRPLLQGSRLTAWELKKENIPFTLNIDAAAATLMQKDKIDMVITGADCITKNGDTANKIGTYNLAVLANAHHIPFYVAAPYSTIDMNLESGDDILIEERGADEVTHFGNRQTAPDKSAVFNPAFDVTPHRLITAIITEKGVVKPNYSENFKRLF